MILTCAHCRCSFDRPYGLSLARQARPQYCSRPCLGAAKRAIPAKQMERFWSRVEIKTPDECWPWMGRSDCNGYGVFDLGGRPVQAHRIAYFDKNPNDDRSLNVCHSCDNPPCCNPGHHWLGTQIDNIDDMDSKGRRRWGAPRRGHECNKTKLSAELAIQIVASHLSNKDLASRLNVTPSAIYNVRAGKAWSHVTGVAKR